MKSILIALFILSNVILFAQTSNSSKFKTVGVSFQNYVKPQSAYGITKVAIWNSPLERANTFDNVKNNLGISAYYSQTNIIRNFGIEYGIGIDFMFINNSYTLSVLDTNYDWRIHDIPAFRTTVVNLSAPLFYVHKLELTDKLTFFPKIGVTTKLFVHGERTQYGFGQNPEEGKWRGSLDYTTYNHIFQMDIADFLFTGSIGTSFSWELNNGNCIGLDLVANKQLFGNAILSRINNITYTEDNKIVSDTENAYPDHYINDEGSVIVTNTSLGNHYAKHSLSSLSIGVSYKFMHR